MRRYPDCIRTDGLCGACSASSRGRDCHNNAINKLLYQRSIAGMTQQQVADAAEMNIRQIQKFESGVMPCHWQKPLTVRRVIYYRGGWHAIKKGYIRTDIWSP